MSELPFVSVLAPCRNECDFIEAAIDSILSGDYPSDKIEILVLDGISDDGTREIVERMSNEDARVRLIDNPNKIVPIAMNIGIKKARGESIIRIDCHCDFAPDYVSKCIEVMQRTRADNVGAYMETVAGNDTAVAKSIASASSSKFGVGNAAFRIGGEETEVDTVPFGTYRKQLLEDIGGYDERLVRNQDIELNSRIRANGGKIIISPEIKLKYFNRASFNGIWQQSFNNGLWNPYTIWLVGGGLQLRHFIPMFFVSSVLVLLVASVLFVPFAILLLLDLALYLSVAGFFAKKVSRKDKVSFGLVFWSFLVLHIAYGLGSLWGILTIPFKFPSRRSGKIGNAIADRKK